jgi:FkbM family methyltransferase
MKTAAIRIKGGVSVLSALDLNDMTTYVLLEQEDWFESEMSFVRAFVRPGMHMIDVGANHGVYGLTFASRLQGEGHVWAFEPASKPYSLLARSVAANGFETVMTALQLGLSDQKRTASMFVSEHTELSSLNAGTGAGESVRLDTLDSVFESDCGGAAIDFVKVDAEGEEANILIGGKRFFSEQSPVVMFEMRHGAVVNEGIWNQFVSYGYGIYRLVPGLNVLVPVDPATSFDKFLLNLFAVKPDRAAELSEQGLLSPDAGFSDTQPPRVQWTDAFRVFPYSELVMPQWEASIREATTTTELEHAWAMNMYLSAMEPSRNAGHRVALLSRCAATWERLLVQRPDQLSFALCLSRALADLGRRSLALTVMEQVLDAMREPPGEAFTLPFLPPLSSYDRKPIVSGRYQDWLQAAILEPIEAWRYFSSFFASGAIERIEPLLVNPSFSLEFRRRYALLALRRQLPLDECYREEMTRAAPDHLNADVFIDLLDLDTQANRNKQAAVEAKPFAAADRATG